MTDNSINISGSDFHELTGEPGFLSDKPYLQFNPVELPPEMDDFELGFVIGNGSTGTVYRSVQRKEFAIKVVRWNPDYLRETAKREYDTVRLFADCEKTVHAIAYYEHNFTSFILQEIGEPILDYFFKNKCSMRMILQALLDVSEALSSIHAKGYTHFDVKPSNILMIKEKARLGDFSHCLRCVPGQEYERSMGTKGYKAPEASPGGKHSGREDMYSLGITMYALLTAGALPFDEKSETDPPEKEKLQISSLFIHPELLSIIRKAAAIDPTERYQTFESFSEDVRSFMKKNDGFLDEKAPAYFAGELRHQTIPPFTFAEGTIGDLS